MINSGHYTFIYNSINGRCQIVGISRRSHLVENNPKIVTLTSQAHHGLYEIISIDGIKPCCTDYNRLLASFGNSLLSRQLGETIYGSRTSRFVFIVRDVSCSIENVIRRNLYNGGTTALRGTRQISRSHMIQLITQFTVILCIVYCRICGTIHDHVDFIFRNKCTYGLFVANIQFPDIGKKINVLRILFGKHLHLVAKLSIGSGY